MNRKFITTACVVQIGLLCTIQAKGQVTTAIRNLADTIIAAFATKPSEASKNSVDISLNGLGGVAIKDTFNHKIDLPKGAKYPALITHLHMLQELKKGFNALKAKIAPTSNTAPTHDGTKKMTQTEAYLSCYKAEIENVYSTALEDHKGLIEQVLRREKELADTHYFFYHAHKKELMILHDFVKQLHCYMHIIAPHCDFSFMRFKNIVELPYKNVYEYLDANEYIDDSDALTMSQMLSFNFALFGSHNSNGSNTFRYFLNDSSWTFNGLTGLLMPIFSHCDFDTKYLDELNDLTKYLTSPTGNLLQICIPYNMVDDLIYLARPGGRPHREVVLSEYYDSKKNRHTCIRPLIEHMCTSPGAISDLSSWQGRIMFFDPMTDMHPAIKMFRYNNIDPANMALYEQKLQDIVVRIFLDYLKKNDIVASCPLIKLHQYMTRYTKAIAFNVAA